MLKLKMLGEYKFSPSKILGNIKTMCEIVQFPGFISPEYKSRKHQNNV